MFKDTSEPKQFGEEALRLKERDSKYLPGEADKQLMVRLKGGRKPTGQSRREEVARRMEIEAVE
ncbi:hypothetical protein EI534_12515 [Pseudomonas frederiksbergensis]|nr:hypothetical protein [Pseudomonas frederiksbergensis]